MPSQIQSILPLLLATLSRAAAPMEVQVPPPWNVFKVARGAQGNTHLGHGEKPMGAVPAILPYLLDPILQGLEAKGFIAYPALYTSGV